jgi:CRISPR-associated endonuclease/helicase Cas3
MTKCRRRSRSVAYLVAAHHGKVRLSIRSLPEEIVPPGDRRFARGVWDDDKLPSIDLGGDVTAPSVNLSLEPMELGLCEQPPFAGQPSWADRMLRLRDRLGRSVSRT